MQAETKQGKLLGIAGVAWLFDAMDVGLLSFVIAALQKEWQLTPNQVGWIGSASSIGMAIGAIFFGMLADRWGRRDVMVLTLLIFSIGTGLSALTTTYGLFVALRVIVGAGLGGELPVASTLVAESVPTAQRGRIVVLLESFWAAGWLVAAVVAYFVIPTWGWRIALIGTSLTAVYAVFLRFSVREPIRTAEAKQQKVSFWQGLVALWQPAYRQATIMLWSVWFLIVLTYYGMFLWLPSVMVYRGFSLIHSFGYVVIMALAQLPGYFVAAWLVEKVGRKMVLATFLLGTAVSAMGFGAANQIIGILAFGMLLNFFNLGAWGVLYAYSPEQYPAIIRGTGTGIAAGIGRLGGIMGSLMVGAMISRGISIQIIFGVFCLALVLAAAAVWFLGVETMQKPLVGEADSKSTNQ